MASAYSLPFPGLIESNKPPSESPAIGAKQCPKCGIWKQIAEFHKDRRKKTGRQSRCKSCRKSMDDYRAGTVEGKAALRMSNWRRQGVLNKAGKPFHWQDWLSMDTSQCWICGVTDSGQREFHVDHDHETGIVRGILCVHCNRAVGGIERTGLSFEKWAELATNYLEA